MKQFVQLALRAAADSGRWSLDRIWGPGAVDQETAVSTVGKPTPYHDTDRADADVWDRCSRAILVPCGECDAPYRIKLLKAVDEAVWERIKELQDVRQGVQRAVEVLTAGSVNEPPEDVVTPSTWMVQEPVSGSDEAVCGKADAPAKKARARRYALAVMDDTLVCGWQTTSKDVDEALIGMVDGELPLPDARACDDWEAAYVWVAGCDPVDDYVSELADEARRNIMKADLLDYEANSLLEAVNSWESDFDEDDNAVEESDEADDDDDEDDEFVECTRYAFVAWEEDNASGPHLVVELQDRGYEETLGSDVGEVVQEGDVDLHTDSDNEATLASVCIPEGDELDDDVLERLIESATEALRDAGCEDDFGHNPIDLVVDAANAFSAARDRARQPRVVDVSLPPKRTVDVSLPSKEVPTVSLDVPQPKPKGGYSYLTW